MKIYSKTYLKFFILFAFCCLLSCENHVEEPEMEELVEENKSGEGENGEDPEIVISYQTDVKPIFTNNCLGCHGNGGRFPDVSTYASVNLNANIIKSEVVSRSMPQGGSLTNDEIQKVKDWIEAGALDN